MATERAESESGAPARRKLRAAASLRAGSAERSAERSAGPAEVETLQTLLQEIRELREERSRSARREEELLARVRQGEGDPVELQHQTPGQSIPFINPTRDAISSLGFKLKPDLYDGSVSLREFLTQFELIARANGWDESTKAVALAASLRGKARSILDGIFNLDAVTFGELKMRLELRFGESVSTQTSYSLFTNRKQKFGENFATLGADLERLAHLAYPECTHEVRDKISCAQFVNALTDGFVKRTLQLENVVSLRLAIERAAAIKAIQGNSFPANNGRLENRKMGGRNFNEKTPEGGFRKDRGKFGSYKADRGTLGKRECWQCGAEGHFRSECPSLIGKKEGN